MPYKEKEINKLYYPIGEVADMFQVNTSMIRFYEKEFEILQPKKNAKGNRLFRPEDIENLKKGKLTDSTSYHLAGNSFIYTDYYNVFKEYPYQFNKDYVHDGQMCYNCVNYEPLESKKHLIYCNLFDEERLYGQGKRCENFKNMINHD